jgi:hypothetical protein
MVRDPFLFWDEPDGSLLCPFRCQVKVSGSESGPSAEQGRTTLDPVSTMTSWGSDLKESPDRNTTIAHCLGSTTHSNTLDGC